MPFDPTDPKYASPLAAMAQDRMSGMLNQPQMKVFAAPQQDGGTNPNSPIMPSQDQLNRTMGMARGGPVNDELAGIKDTIRSEFAARGLDFDRFVSNPAVMDEVGKSIQSQGKNGDTILAHINPEEASLLKKMGGSGDINPHTGLPQFDNPSMGAYDAPSSSGSYGSIGGGGGSAFDIGGISAGGGGGYGSTYGNRDSGSFSDFGGSMVSDGGSMGSVSYGGGGGGGRDFYATMPRSTATETSLSPMGAGGGSISMGQAQSQTNEAIGSVPSFAGIDPMSGLPIGGASNISGLGYLATAPDLAQTIAPQPTSVDLGNTAPQLSDIDFSNISPGMYQGATMPGGISNFAAAPQDPGYTDTGITAMRMAAGLEGRPGTIDKKTGIGYGTEFYLNQLGELAPVAQTPGATIINRMIDKGYNPAFGIYSAGRTNLEQAMLQAGADGNLTAAPGRSMHNFGLAMDVKNLPDQGYRDLARIAKEEGWGWGTMQDPAHVQMAPWGAGAVQTARRLGAEPFTGPATTASMFTPAAKEQNALNKALNTVSNIAGELFGVKSAEAAVVGPQGTMISNPEAEMFSEMQRERFADQYGPFMSSDGTDVAPAQPGSFGPSPEIIDIPLREINRQFVSPEYVSNITPEAQVAGSGVFPSYEQARMKYPDRAPGAQPNFPAVTESIDFMVPPTPMERFGLPQDMATYGAEAPVYNIREGALGAFGPYGISSEYVAPSTGGVSAAQPDQQTRGIAPVSPRISTGLTSPLSIGATPRQEPLDPTQSTSPMTAEQLKGLGVYQTPLKEGQRVRDNFNEAYGDATARGIEVFEWTNPKTGETSYYKSGAPEADLPSKIAKNAKGDFPFPQTSVAPQTEYEKTVAALEANDMIANGMSKEEYADAMGVPVDQVKTRITTQFGPPMAEYYTKTVLESLAGMTGDEGNFAGLMNLTSMFSPLGILGLAGKAGYNAYRKSQETKAEGGYISPLASMGKR